MKLTRFIKADRDTEAKWSFLAVCTERGECPLLTFLRELDGRLAKDGERILKLMKHISKKTTGPRELPDELSHQINEHIFEFIKGDIRVFWFYDDEKVVICSHGLIKKGRKTPKRDIEKAKNNFTSYMEAKKQNIISITDDI